MRVVSVNTGTPREVAFRTQSLPETGIWKQSRQGPVRITSYGVEGDDSADRRYHHDAWMRVYAYALEDYHWWSAELGGELAPGVLGEQLTTEGVDVNAAVLGEVWRVGTARLQIAHVRTPCQTLQGWIGELGFESRGMVKRFTRALRPGPYFRVLEEGVVQAGDAILVEERPDHGVTVTDLFRALTFDRAYLPRVAVVPGLKPLVYAAAARQASAAQPFLTEG